ncbi:ABC transporter ATP-binding protein [Anaerotruncus sp. 80]|jgi:ATP-binding cassette subfamily F protein 3|uniref:ABC transporter ATP-binding protein n=1 Tax=Anaerotruncus colihominis TaxID=169435 RepID=A0A845QHH2_9FIRM|nr:MULTISPECIES: ABC-F family ATP-binding cassette domain-containing protein [Anaerotruncus]NBH60874.1 ABC transporter ATP-binding protein [Anaerotruncus colihominis]NCF01529.1 ABC transporter ATP-binding protein [Anaerotruncus sp. 80]
MIRVEKLSYGFPAKDLYHDISFSLEIGQHCALIGSNGSGKSTLVDMLIQPDEYLYDGKIYRSEDYRIGYASQFNAKDKLQDCTVFEYLSERFLKIQKDIAQICEEMATAEDMEAALEKYQQLLDINEAMDGDNYESNIRKQLHIAHMSGLAETKLSKISGGEYKVLQIIREMLLAPDLLILDEPDAFLDFANLSSLCQLINEYKGTLLVVTHSRYLLNHCFNKILHLENADLQEFDGNYTEYRCSIFREKLKLRMQNAAEQEEIERTEQMVQILRKRATDMVNPVIGRSVNAKQSQLDRLRARQIKAPFIEIREPEIVLPEVSAAESGTETKKTVLHVADYEAAFDEDLLQNVNFQLFAGEKVTIVGANGTGKTTLIRDILENDNPSIYIDENTKYAYLSQLQGVLHDENKTVYQVLQNYGFETKERARGYLAKFCLEEALLDQRVGQLSGGEQNLLQIALITNSNAELLILDEPTSHLDIYAQMALEKAISEYRGAVLMVSHDFYLAAGCADYVLLVEDNTVRRMRTKNFRKMVYDKYFDRNYLETDKRKQELEATIAAAFKRDDFAAVEKLCGELEEVSAEGFRKKEQ